MITSWSWTKYSDHKQCPRKFKYKYIDKLPEEKGPALVRGAMIHDLAASYINGSIKAFPKELNAFAAEFKLLRKEFKKKPFIVEDEWAYKQDWSTTTWFAKDAWMRMKLDCARPLGKDTLSIIDWKTGKYRASPQYMEQLELYALSALTRFPDITTVHPQLVYLDAQVVFPSDRETLKFTQHDVDRLKVLWHTRIRPMFEAETHTPNKTVLCGWCSFRKAIGGPCEHGTRSGH